MMTRYFHAVIFLIGLMSPFVGVAQTNDVKADVTISIQQNQEIWAGQQVTLNLDLKTTGFSFSNSHFNLPEVSGAFLMQTDTTTIKMSKKIDGETWQIVRYPLALYPQKPGQLVVPSINVRFKTSAGFGSTEKAFEFQTEPLELTIKLPPGVKDGDLVITTTSFELDYDWQPETGTAKTGDAITLTVTRQANDISAMLLPPLPVYTTEGLAVYPQAPDVSDKTNRGDLTGERIDSIIWVIEKPGQYDIPGIRFQWWDPKNQELKQQIIPGQSLSILSLSPDQIVAEAETGSEQSGKRFIWLLLAIFMVSAAIFLWLGIRRKPSGQSEDTEKSKFSALQTACRSNHPGQTHSALHGWTEWYAPVLSRGSRAMTLGEFSQACDDEQLTAEIRQLEEALISSDSNWQGDGLLRALLHVRSKINSQKVVQLEAYLAPLNP